MADSTELRLSTPSAKIEGEFKRPSGFPRLRPAYILKVNISSILDIEGKLTMLFGMENSSSFLLRDQSVSLIPLPRLEYSVLEVIDMR